MSRIPEHPSFRRHGSIVRGRAPRHFGARALMGTAALTATLMAGTAKAQAAHESSPAAAASAALGEVIVTAQKRSENLQNTPLAISAFTSSKIEQLGLAGPQQLQFNVPSLTFGNVNGANQLALRGIGNDTIGTAAEPSVATYQDGIYTGSLFTQGIPLFDLQRIEVLRGPQGTLYGRNTTGGVINYISKPASFSPGAFAAVSYGNYNAVQGDVGVTGPLLADKVAGRLSVHFGEHDGYRHNITTGASADADRMISGRGEILFTPTNALTITLRGDVSHDWSTNPPELITTQSLDGVTTQSTPLGIFSLPAAALATIPGLLSPADLAKLGAGSIASYLGLIQPGPLAPDPTKTLNFTGANARAQFITDSNSGSITANWDLGPAAVKSITSYRYSRLRFEGNFEGYSVSEVAFLPVIQTSKQFTQEFDVSGKAFDNRLDWLLGAFYLHDDANLAANSYIPALSQSIIAGISLATPPGSPYAFDLSRPLQTNLFTAPSIYSTVTVSAPDLNSGAPLIAGVSIPTTAYAGILTQQESQSVAGFAQATYKLTDDLRLTGGLRFTADRKDVVRSIHSNLGYTLAVLVGGLTPAQAGLCEKNVASKSWSAPTGTLGIDYDIAPHILSYAKVSWGYKAGGANASTCSGFFNPEHLTAYESGVKAVFADGQVLTNVATYYYNYDAIQFTRQLNGTSDIQNAGTATAFGVELEYALRPQAIPGLQFDGSASYEDSHYGEGKFQDPAFQDYYEIKGNELIRAPKWKANFGFQYTRDLADRGLISLRGDAAYTTKIYNDIFNGKAIYESGVTQPAYWVANAQLNWISADKRYQAQLFVNNLTNTYYASSRYGANTPAALVTVAGQFAPPRTFGARLTMKLGSEAR